MAGAQKAEQVLRDQVAGAALGQGISNAWQIKTYPKAGKADNPASYVYTKAQRIVAAFASGATVTASGATWLVIPLPAAVALGLDRMTSRPGGKPGGLKAKYSDITAAIQRFGNLKFVPIGGNRALLIADPRSARGTGRASGTPLFLLVKSVRLPRLLDIDAAAAAGTQAMTDAA